MILWNPDTSSDEGSRKPAGGNGSNEKDGGRQLHRELHACGIEKIGSDQNATSTNLILVLEWTFVFSTNMLLHEFLVKSYRF